MPEPAGGAGGTAQAGNGPVLHLDAYDGPMDLLLDLAERQRVDLGQLSILALIEQFLAELDGRLRQATIERRAGWVVVASRLVLLRSRLLAPASPEAAAAAQCDAAAELRRLDAVGQVRAAAAWLQARPQLGHDVFARPCRGRDPRTASYMALMQACLVALRGPGAQPAGEPAYVPRPPALWSVAQATLRIRTLLEQAPHKAALTDCLPPIGRDEPDRTLKARAALASTLAAGLELARQGAIVVEQDTPFSQIKIRATPV